MIVIASCGAAIHWEDWGTGSGLLPAPLALVVAK